MAHLAQTVGHGEVLVDRDKLGTHQTAGSVLVVLQQVHDVAGLFHILDVVDHLLAVLLVELLNEVDGVIGIK